MSTADFIIETIQKQNTGQYKAWLQAEEYVADPKQRRSNNLDSRDWQPLERLLVDSDRQHIIYVINVKDTWRHIRFPKHVWPILDRIISEQATVHLALANDTDSPSIELTRFSVEGKELVDNMENNANYGEEMATLVAEHFPRCLER